MSQAQEKYIHNKQNEIALLKHHGYIYQPSDQDLVELAKNQLTLESARHCYKAMNTFSYDYLWSNKAFEFKKIIQDSQTNVHNLTHRMAEQRYEWDKKSLQAIADKENVAHNNESAQPANNASNASIPNNKDAHVDINSLIPYEPEVCKFKPIQDSEHRYDMPVNVAQALRSQFIDRDNEYSNAISDDDVHKIDYMLNAMTKAHNNMTVEYAQAGLQAWQKVQNAQTDEERIQYIKTFEQCYNALHRPTQSIGKNVKPIDQKQLNTMLQGYQQILNNNQHESSQQLPSSPFIDRLTKRSQAITESQEQLKSNQLVLQDFKMSAHARGYLMANQLNYAAFNPMLATSIQHRLTQENLEIIESMAALSSTSGISTCNQRINQSDL